MESYKAGEGARPPLSGLKSQVTCSQGMGLLVPKLHLDQLKVSLPLFPLETSIPRKSLIFPRSLIVNASSKFLE